MFFNTLHPFNGFNLFGGVLSRYNPLIEYKWRTMSVDNTGVRYLNDSGSKPKYHAEMFTGQGVKFNGVDQDVNLGHVAKSNKGSLLISAYGITSLTESHLYCNWQNNRLYVTHRNNGNSYRLGLGGSGAIDTGVPTVENATIGLTWDSNSWDFYLNGEHKGSGIYSGSISDEPTCNAYIGSNRGASSFNDTIESDLIILDSIVLTPQQIQAQYQSPETFLYRENGVLKSDILRQAEIDNVVAYLPMCEKDEYVRDLVNYNEFNLVSDGFNSIGANWDGVTLSYNSGTNDRLDYTIANEDGIDTTSKYMFTRLKVANVSGTPYVRHASSEGGWTQYGDKPIVNGDNYFITPISTNPSGLYSLIYVGEVGESVDVLSWEVSIITSGIYPIQNFTNSCRDDAKNLNKGLQTSKWLRDDLGVPYGLSSYLEGDGVGYVDTGWIPDVLSDFTIEVIKTKDTKQVFDGIWGTTERLSIGTEVNGQIRVDVGSTNKYISPPTFDENIYYVTVSYFASTKEVRTYLNGVLSHTFITDVTTSLNSFQLGSTKLSTAIANSSKRLFKVHEKVLTQEEINNNYQKYINQGLFGVPLVDGSGNELTDGNDTILVG